MRNYGHANPSSLSVRNHGGVPDIDEDVFELEVGGLVNKPVKLSMKDLKDPNKFPYVTQVHTTTFICGTHVLIRQVEVTVTLQCSGTRRIEQIHEYPGDGDELINAVSKSTCATLSH